MWWEEVVNIYGMISTNDEELTDRTQGPTLCLIQVNSPSSKQKKKIKIIKSKYSGAPTLMYIIIYLVFISVLCRYTWYKHLNSWRVSIVNDKRIDLTTVYNNVRSQTIWCNLKLSGNNFIVSMAFNH